MNTEQFAWKMIEIMPRLVRGFSRQDHNCLTRGEITIPQFWALEYLSSNGKSKMSKLAKLLDISRPAATGLIDRLIIQNLAKREDDSSDRRVVWIEITSKGKHIIDSIRKKKHKTLVRIFGKLSASDREQYLRIIEKILKTLQIPAEEKQI